MLSWSGGKDSAMAAYHLLTSQKYEIVSLMTTVTEGFDRISMHGVRRELLEAQAASLNIPLYVIMIPHVPLECRVRIFTTKRKARPYKKPAVYAACSSSRITRRKVVSICSPAMI